MMATGADFYPRPPRGGRLAAVLVAAPYPGISIHALREEGDLPFLLNHVALHHFYPRPPRGGRLAMLGHME